MLKKIIIILGIILISNTAFCQNKPKAVHNIGVSAGLSTGYGISYRYWPTKFGIQITSTPSFFGPNFYSFNIGVTGLYTIRDKKHADLYLYLGNLFQNNNTNSSYSIGTGFGVKLDFLDNLNINFQFGYGGLHLNAEYPSFSMIAETGLYYHF